MIIRLKKKSFCGNRQLGSREETPVCFLGDSSQYPVNEPSENQS